MSGIFKDDEFYTPVEVAKKLKITKEAVYKWIRANKIKHYKLGRIYRLLGKDLNEFLQRENKND